MEPDIDPIINMLRLFKTTIEKLDVPGRTNIITLRDVIYCQSHIIGNSCSYSIAGFHMYINNILDVTDRALIYKSNAINCIYFEEICNAMIEFFYEDRYESRIIAVDGSYLALPKELAKDGYQLSKKKTYCTALLSSLFDVENKLLINYRLCTIRNEREALKSQINYLKPNDILVMDRGYYDTKLIFFLNNLKIHVIMRLEEKLKIVKKTLSKGQASMKTSLFLKKQSIPFRIIHYKIDDNNYYIGTTIMNHTPEYFKKIYWERWSIETHFRESKYILSLKNLLSESENGIKREIYCHHILFVINSVFKNQLRPFLSKNESINTKILLGVIVNRIIELILYKKITSNTEDEILRICNGLLERKVLNDPNRHFDRVKPTGKWYFSKNKNNK